MVPTFSRNALVTGPERAAPVRKRLERRGRRAGLERSGLEQPRPTPAVWTQAGRKAPEQGQAPERRRLERVRTPAPVQEQGLSLPHQEPEP